LKHIYHKFEKNSLYYVLKKKEYIFVFYKIYVEEVRFLLIFDNKQIECFYFNLILIF